MKELTVMSLSKMYESLYKMISDKTSKDVAFAATNNAIIMYALTKNIEDISFETLLQQFKETYETVLFACDSPEYIAELKYAFYEIEHFLSPYEQNFEVIEKLLGNVLERHINQKNTGSYYTPADTTEYITYNAVLIATVNKLTEKLQRKICKILCIDKNTGILNNENTVIENMEILAKELSKKEKNEFIETLYGLSIIDPTCGSGAFIIKAFECLEVFSQLLGAMPDYSRILKCLFGVDIEKEAIQLTKMRLLLKISEKAVSMELFNELFKVNFVVADALKGADYVWEENGFDWRSFGRKFDCIIGNPPYVEKKRYVSDHFITRNCGNLYAHTIERACNISDNKSVISFIVPLSFVATPRMKPAKDYLESCSKDIYYATFADRPGCIFSGVHQRLTIFFAEISEGKSTNIYSSSYKYWYNSERNELFSGIKFIENDSVGALAKFGCPIEKEIYKKIISQPDSFIDIFVAESQHSLYTSTRIGFWAKAFPNNVFTSREYKEFHTSSLEDKILALAIINSSTFYYFWVLTSDCWHITNTNFADFCFDKNRISCVDIKQLQKLVEMLMLDLERNKKYIGSKQTDYEYKHKYSKPIIDAIDECLAPLFNLNSQELKYIKEYTEKYRLNTL